MHSDLRKSKAKRAHTMDTQLTTHGTATELAHAAMRALGHMGHMPGMHKHKDAKHHESKPKHS